MPIPRKAHAKINLALAVAPPDPEHRGWHPIASWMHAIDLADELTVDHDGRTSFDRCWLDPAGRTHPVEWEAGSDLAARAHAALEREADRPLPTRLTLRKRTPAGGGLGGGSSDAAAALSAIAELHALDFSPDRLRAIAHALGSDVPFFLDAPVPRPALVEGFGDRLARTPPLPAMDVMLICPPFPCATPSVYRAFDDDPGSPEAFARRAETIRRLATDPPSEPHELAALLFNDLEPAACRAEPRLAELLDTCRRALPAPVHMTGSGSTLFVLLPSGGGVEAAAAARRACRDLPGTRVLETSLR